MANITEKLEIRVKGDESDFVFIADSDEGKLIIRQESEHGKEKSLCTITLKNPDELQDFFEGLRRVLTATGSISPQQQQTSQGPVQPKQLGLRNQQTSGDRQQQIDKARQSNPNAFQPWTPEEEAEIARSYGKGESPESIGKRLKRSGRAIEMRLKKLGVLSD